MSNIDPSSIESWLYDAGSFMRRLKRYHLTPELRVLKQSWQYPNADERDYLHVKPRHYVFIREVEIYHQNEPLLFARAAIPATLLAGKERRLMHLGGRSLGSVLFSYPRLLRSPFAVKRDLFLPYSSESLWQRRSLFYLKKKPLLLTEIFLPRLIDFIKSL